MIWHNLKKEEVAMQLESQPKKGLTEKNVGIRLVDYGSNILTTRKKKSMLNIFLEKLAEPVNILLIAAAVISVVIACSGEEPDVLRLCNAVIMLASALCWALVSTYRERSASKAVMQLKAENNALVKVMRNSVNKLIPASNLVPGDIVRLEAGTIIPADGRLLITNSFSCDENVITGSIKTVYKDCDAVLEKRTPLSKRINMVYMGTVAMSGSATMMVTETGVNTELGKREGAVTRPITTRTAVVRSAMSIRRAAAFIVLSVSCGFLLMPLFTEKIPELHSLSQTLAFIFENSSVADHISFALTLAVCSIPFGLPQTIVYSLSSAVKRITENGVSLRLFRKAEVIGCTSVVCIDKTGTLTQNDPTITAAWPFGDSLFYIDEGFWSEEGKYLLRCAALCTQNSVVYENANNDSTGDKIDDAIVTAYAKGGFSYDDLFRRYPRVFEIPFDTSRKLMTVIHELDGIYLTVTKGAPDVLLPKCTDIDTENINRQISDLCSRGLQVIAVATYTCARLPENITPETVENDLTFIGLLGISYSHREDISDCVKEFAKAGIHTVVITNDHPDTALAVAHKAGVAARGDKAVTGAELAAFSDKKLSRKIDNYTVFARIPPEDKVRLIETWQKKGECVLMNAGGIEDAPALHQADVSCSVEQKSADVALDAADIKFNDNKFENIFDLIKTGRLLNANLAKLTEYSISCAVAQGFAMIAGRWLWGVNIFELVPLMILNLLIYWLILPSFAKEPAEKELMRVMPAPNNGQTWTFLEKARALLYGISAAAATSTAFAIGMGLIRLNKEYSVQYGVTMAFAEIVLSTMVLAVNSRSNKPLLFSMPCKNPRILLYAPAIILFAAGMVFTPYLNMVFGLNALTLYQGLEVLALACVQLLVSETVKLRMYLS